MGKIVVSEFVTLDGVMEAPGGEPGHPHSGWVVPFIGQEQMRYKIEEILEAESLLLGRITYESFAESWPQRSNRRRKAEADMAKLDDHRDDVSVMADKMNSMPKYVVSTTLRDPKWHNSRVISNDVAGEVARLKQQSLGPILVTGSRMLAQTLMERDLVDEYRLTIMPVVLGSGRKLFPETPSKMPLALTDTRKFTTGVVVNVYSRFA